VKRNLRTRLALSFAAAVGTAFAAFGLSVILVFYVAERAEAAHDGTSVSEEDLREDVERVLFSVAVVAPLAVLASGGLGLWLARRAIAPLSEATVRVRMARGSALDLTLPVRGTGDEWDELATTLNALLKDARSSMQRIRQFTGDAAHELRTPLTTIIGESEVALRRERDETSLRASLEIVRGEAERLTGILNSLLTLARSDTGTLLMDRQTFSLDETALEAVRLALSKARPSRAAESLVVEGSAGRILGDRVLVQQAIRNLVDNGLRHGREPVKVTLQESAGVAIIRVSDAGPGIPPALRPHLFQRFARGDEARAAGGTGLGLAISRAIAESHGGTLDLLPGDKTVFELRFPSGL
jgi:two-component system heavy metal sensor histidine kinase CusS